VWVTPGFGGCIFIIDTNRWEQLSRELSDVSWNDADGMDLQRFFADCYEDTMDGQGRVLIPKYLLEHADIKRDMVVLGAFDRIEVWDPDRYSSYRQTAFSEERMQQLRQRKLAAVGKGGESSG
jgi:MraZ protein